MKRQNLTRLLSLLLVLIIAVSAFVSCGANKYGKPMLTYGKSSISVNMFEFMQSRIKGALANAGYSVETNEFWNTVASSDGTVYDDYFKDQCLIEMKKLLIASDRFDEEKLTLPDSAMKRIDQEMSDLVEYVGDGSKNKLNSILAEFGANYDILRQLYILEEKQAFIKEYLFGPNMIDIKVKEEHYRNNYLRFKQILLRKFEYMYEEDESGDDIYFIKDSDFLKIAYDTANGEKQYNDNGDLITDKFGKPAYFDEDGNIAYDKEGGIRRMLFDDKGEPRVRTFDSDEITFLRESAESISSSIAKNDKDGFEKKAKENFEGNEGYESPEFVNGIYLKKEQQYPEGLEYLTEISDKLKKMEYGDITVYESENAIHIIMKYELDEGAFGNRDNEAWFSSFDADITEIQFEIMCESRMDNVTVDEKLLESTPKMRDVRTNKKY